MSHLTLNRHKTYSLISRLFTHGLTERDLEAVRQIDVLARHSPALFDPDESAADHQHIFGFNVFPYESVFLDPSGQLGGVAANTTIRDYKQAGFAIDSAAGSPDHIGQQLAYLAFLSKAQDKAREENNQIQLELIREYQRAFLDTHILCWLPPLVLSIKNQNNPFYSSVADFTVATVVNHRMSQDRPAGAAFNLPQPPNLFDQEGTGLKEIVAYLLTPVYSGIYFSRDDIGRLAKDQSVPRGFGDRRQMMLSLIRSVAAYGDTDQVLSSTQHLANKWEEAYREMAASSEPMLAAAAWTKRASETADLIELMRSRLKDIE
jgi:TorA maturation chaperone TorD